MSEALARACRRTAEQATRWILGQLKQDGSLGDEVTDVAAYYKLPMLLLLTGRNRDAHRVLDHVTAAFARNDGDFATEEEVITADPILAGYPGTISGWIGLAALRAGRFDIAMPAYGHLCRYHEPSSGGATLAGPRGGVDDPVELLMTAQLGYAALYFGEHARARGCGKALGELVAAQPALDQRLLLRRGRDGRFIEAGKDDAAFLRAVEVGRPDQAFSFVGHPIAFLTQLYRATGDGAALDAARRYAGFALDCGDALAASHFAHAVGWGMALLHRATGDSRHRALAEAIAEQLIDAQGDDGGWLEDDPLVTRLDQSAEAAIWLTEMSAIL
ncbi:MAG: hypothetical protein R3F65_21215 [bacterium]